VPEVKRIAKFASAQLHWSNISSHK